MLKHIKTCNILIIRTVITQYVGPYPGMLLMYYIFIMDFRNIMTSGIVAIPNINAPIIFNNKAESSSCFPYSN